MDAHQLVEAHFAGAATAASDRRMWRHLPGCAACRGRYRALSLLEALEPDAVDRARARMAPAIFAPRPSRRTFYGVAIVAAAAVVLLVARPREQFRARGTGPEATAPHPTLSIARIIDNEMVEEPGAERVGAVVHPHDKLAFSYVNPPELGARYLMIFAVDEAGQFYWYWPAWTTPASDPEAIPIRFSTTPVELAEAVRHPFSTGEIVMYALFARRPYHVREVETAVMTRTLDRFDAIVVRETLEVMPVRP